jgi:hypothetical protein
MAQTTEELDLCAGVAVVGDEPQVLCRQDLRWVLIGEDGVARPTTGLDGATVFDVATDNRGALAAGSINGEAALWRSADGVTWHAVLRMAGRHSMFTAVASAQGDAMALGSTLSAEDVPNGTLAVRRHGPTWREEQVRGLEGTSYQAITTLAVRRDGWLAAAIGSDGSVIHTSADGALWVTLPGGRLDDAAVQGVLADDGTVCWIGNAMGGSGALTGTIGGGRGPAGVSELAHAVGLVRTRRGRVSYWLVDGKLQTAEVR